MGIISKYVDGRIDKKLELLNLNNDLGINIVFDEKYKLKENKIFFLGETEEILKFYKTERPKNYQYPTKLFYREVSGNCPILHFPLANIITKTMVNLIFSESPIINYLSGNKVRDKDTNELIEKIYDENAKSELFQKACEMESYSGAVGFKIILDKNFSKYPIVVPYPKEDIEINKQYGRITEIIFKDYYEDFNENKYTLYSIYGRGFIKYKLYSQGRNKRDKVSVPLNKLEETTNLKDLYFFNRDGTPYNDLMAVYKENKTGAKSDYDNLRDDFAALDEVYSNLVDFIRKSKIKTYRPENTLATDINTGKIVIPNEYDSSDILLSDKTPVGNQEKIERDVIDGMNSIQGYQNAFNNILQNALLTTGLSAASIGIDRSGANSSGEALNIRERVSLRTRSEKIKRWNHCIEYLTELLLNMCNITVSDNNVYLNNYNGNIKVSFVEYESPTFNEKVASLSLALSSNLIDLDTALSTLYPEKSEEELELMKLNIDGQLPDEEDIINNELNKEDEVSEE